MECTLSNIDKVYTKNIDKVIEISKSTDQQIHSCSPQHKVQRLHPHLPSVHEGGIQQKHDLLSCVVQGDH